ncbi:MAG: cadmium-translocating P-type ATPase [Bacteroidetes bacterium CHB5]|nr:cadmium-translocating P-type ATPase [Bacteroidetes bacterium CHB5]
MSNAPHDHDQAHDQHDHTSCCTVDEKVSEHTHDHNHQESTLKLFIPAGLSLLLLACALVFDYYLKPAFFTGWLRICWYGVAYLPVAWPVWRDAFNTLRKGEIFTEFLLMTIATIGAFAIGEFPEGVAVMLFYAVGEIFQTLAVRKAKFNINKLLDQRPEQVTVIENNQPQLIKAANVKIGSIIELKPGEKLGLDGELLSEVASFNTAALTGESKPDKKRKGETVLAGMINLNTVTLIKVTTAFQDSKLSRILNLVQQAATQKAKTELFIRKFARYYTPTVALLAILICVAPYFIVSEYIFREWLYRALIFLVISCPCALVISIPLGYFGGIGAASRNGILFKGGNFLDVLAGIRHVVLDKTGTLTQGIFQVQVVKINSEFDKTEILNLVNVLESKSTHPIATAIHRYVGELNHTLSFQHVEEIPGHGLKGLVNNKELLVGNFRLMDKFAIEHHENLSGITDTVIAIAYDKKFAGYIIIADEIKADAAGAIQELHRMNIKTTILSGDQHTLVKNLADKLGIDTAFGDLLPEDKVNKLKEIKNQNERVAFVGDGVNDAPVIALSDVGIAMGGLGSDATIETADVVIQDDKPSKIATAIHIGKKTRQLVWQNITLAFGVKAIVLLLGAGGLATLWEAVFADVGVALLAILNAIRIQHMRF